jgi:DNA-binding response OmpR family regulator
MVMRAGVVEVRPSEFLATVEGEPIRLSVRELQLLTALVQRAGRIVSREELYTAVWRRPFRRSERSVDVYVRKLRSKLPAGTIETHYGFGYRFIATHSQPFHTRATGP